VTPRDDGADVIGEEIARRLQAGASGAAEGPVDVRGPDSPRSLHPSRESSEQRPRKTRMLAPGAAQCAGSCRPNLGGAKGAPAHQRAFQITGRRASARAEDGPCRRMATSDHPFQDRRLRPLGHPPGGQSSPGRYWDRRRMGRRASASASRGTRPGPAQRSLSESPRGARTSCTRRGP
jgi:hypothetical protein